MSFKPATTFPIKLKDDILEGISGEGTEQASIVIVGMCPGREETEALRPFVGPSGQLLNDLMAQCGIDRKLIWLTNIVNFRTHDNGKDRPPTKDEVDACAGFLDAELDRIKPKIIGALGNDAIKRLMGDKKVGGITKIRGIPIWSERYNAYIIPTFHPSYLVRNQDQPRLRENMMADLRLMVQFSTNKVEERKFPTDVTFYHTVEGTEDTPPIAPLIEKLKAQEWVVFDVETNGKNMWEKDFKIFCISFSWEKGKAHVITNLEDPRIRSLIQDFFSTESVRTVGHNGGFDIRCLRAYEIIVKNFKFDTMLAHHLLDENSKHGLKELAWSFTDMGGYEHGLDEIGRKLVVGFNAEISELRAQRLKLNKPKKKGQPDDGKLEEELQKVTEKIDHLLAKVKILESDNKGFWFSMPEFDQKEMWRYCGADTDCAYRLLILFSEQLKKQGLNRLFYNISVPMSEVVAEMEWYGVKIDTAKVDELINKYTKILEDLDYRLNSFPEIKKAEKMLNEGAKTPQPFNFGSPVQLRTLLFDIIKLPSIKTTKTGNSTDEEVLEALSKLHEIPSLLLQRRKVDKLISTYLAGVKAKLDYNDRLHTHFLQHGTVTGRMASRDPNLQNIPKKETGEIKEIFIVEPGNILLEADYKQMDFRMWANESKDGQMYIDITSGKDIHKVIASQIFNIPEEKVVDEQRNISKTGVYASIYGIAPFNLAKQLGISEALAEKTLKYLGDRYSAGFQWFKEVYSIAYRNKEVVNTFGRKRRLPAIDSDDLKIRSEAKRQAVNAIIQGDTSDVLHISMIRIWRRMKKEGLKAHFVLEVHDSMMIEAPLDEKDKVLNIIKEESSRPIEGINIAIGFDLKGGSRWGTAEKINMEVAKKAL